MNRWALALVSVLLASSPVFAFPSLLSLDGYLTNSSGSARNGSHQFVFSLYTSGNTLLWTENQSLTVSSGKLNALLGSVTALNLPFDQDYYLGVKVNTDSEMTPKYRIAASAYSYHAETADTANSLAPNATALGALRLGNDSSACTSANSGALRWTGIKFEFCNGNNWKFISGLVDGTSQSQAGLSCKALLDEGYSTGSGVYWIDPTGSDTADAFQVYCDMVTHGGGWTLVGTHADNTNPDAISSYGTVLTNANANSDNLYKGVWENLNFNTAWMQLDNYADNFYFENIATPALRNTMLTNMVTRRNLQATKPDCRYFIGSIGQPGSGGAIGASCGGTGANTDGWVDDVNGGWCWWSYIGAPTSAGSGSCDGATDDKKGRIWVR